MSTAGKRKLVGLKTKRKSSVHRSHLIPPMAQRLFSELVIKNRHGSVADIGSDFPEDPLCLHPGTDPFASAPEMTSAGTRLIIPFVLSQAKDGKSLSAIRLFERDLGTGLHPYFCCSS